MVGGGGSNYGPNYADLAIQANSTSEAAARVSRFANFVIYKYPHLTIHQLKWLLILGADLSGLPIRSRGILNEGNSLKLADELAKGRSFPEAINKVFNGFSGRNIRLEKFSILNLLKQTEGEMWKIER